MPLSPCTDLSTAEWIVNSRQPWHKTVTFGPEGFAAYARLRFIPDPAYKGQSENYAPRSGGALSDAEQLRLALGILAALTSTPGSVYFCLWDGWGVDVEGDEEEILPPPSPQKGPAGPGIAPGPRSKATAPKVRVPNRAYYLFEGPLAEFVSWQFEPAFVWPADHAWCVTKDVDPHWAGIGAARGALDRLRAEPRLDVVLASPDEDVPAYR